MSVPRLLAASTPERRCNYPHCDCPWPISACQRTGVSGAPLDQAHLTVAIRTATAQLAALVACRRGCDLTSEVPCACRGVAAGIVGTFLAAMPGGPGPAAARGLECAEQVRRRFGADMRHAALAFGQGEPA